MPIKLNGSGSGSVALNAPANTSGGSDISFTLPTADGTSGQVLQTNGSGALSFASASSDNITEGNTSVEVVDTGSNGEVRFTTEGTRAMTINSSQQVGIGTTSPASGNLLHVKSGGTYGSVTVDNSSNTGGGAFTARQNGSVRALFGTSGYMLADNSSDAAIYAETGNIRFFAPGEKMRILSNGSVLIGCTTENARGLTLNPQGSGSSPTAIFSKNNDGNANACAFINAGSVIGTISYNTNSTAYNTSSDYRLKENVVPLTGAADRINQLQVHRFNFIADPDTTVDGFLAHEAQAVVPECVTGEKDEVEVWKENEELPDGVSVGDSKLDEDGNTIPVYQGIDQSKLVPLLTAALQEALAKIETLEAANASLEARLTALEGGN